MQTVNTQTINQKEQERREKTSIPKEISQLFPAEFLQQFASLYNPRQALLSCLSEKPHLHINEETRRAGITILNTHY